MKLRGMLLLAFTFLVAVGWNSSSSANVLVDLQLRSVTASTATFDVGIEFTGAAGDLLEVIQLSVVGSDSLLTSADTDYSRFAFTLDTAALPDWTADPSIGLGGVTLLFPLDPVAGPFLSPTTGLLQIGTLEVDLTGLPMGTYLVTLAGNVPGLETAAAGLIGGTFVELSAAAGGLTFNQPGGVSFATVPEPGTLGLLVCGLAVAGFCGSRQRRA